MLLNEHDRVYRVLLCFARRGDAPGPVGLVGGLARLSSIYLQMQVRRRCVARHADAAYRGSRTHVLALLDTDSAEVAVDRVVRLFADAMFDHDMEAEASFVRDRVDATTGDGSHGSARCELQVETGVYRGEFGGIQVVLAEVARGIKEFCRDIRCTLVPGLEEILHRRRETREVIAWESHEICVRHFSVWPLPFLRRFHHAPVRSTAYRKHRAFEGGEIGSGCGCFVED